MAEGNECLPEGVGVGSCGTGALRRTDKHTFGVRVPSAALTPAMRLIGARLCQNKGVLFVVCQVHLNNDEQERQLSEPTQNV